MGKRPDQTLVLVFCFSTNLPLGCVPAVPVLIRWHYRQDQIVLSRRLEARQPIFTVWEHAAPMFSENHLSPTAVELLPHLIILQCDSDAFEGQRSGKVSSLT